MRGPAFFAYADNYLIDRPGRLLLGAHSIANPAPLAQARWRAWPCLSLPGQDHAERLSTSAAYCLQLRGSPGEKGRSRPSDPVSVGRIAPTVHSQRTPIRGRICEFVTKYHFNVGYAII
jgi:hypothetical protein